MQGVYFVICSGWRMRFFVCLFVFLDPAMPIFCFSEEVIDGVLDNNENAAISFLSFF